MLMLPDEALRLATLDRTHLLDTPEEEAFDRITRVASQVMATPIALISLVDADRQWFKSRVGLALCETPRESSLCSHAIRADEPLVIPDARLDLRFADNPLVVGAPFIRFYAGVPLRMGNGHSIGTLCTIDTRPRRPSGAQMAALADLARMAVDGIELRQLASTDSLTGALSRRGLDHRLDAEVARARRYGRALSVVLLDLDHFKHINDQHGHGAGDLVLHTVAETCRASLRSVDILGRLGGEEFVVVLPETQGKEAQRWAERLRQAIALRDIIHNGTRLQVTASLGVSMLGQGERTASRLLNRADAAMYRAKSLGRDRVVADLGADSIDTPPPWQQPMAESLRCGAFAQAEERHARGDGDGRADQQEDGERERQMQADQS